MRCQVTCFYDVWGNAKEGWEINDSFDLGEIELPDSPTNKEICQCLHEAGVLFTSDMRRLLVIDGVSTIEVYLKRGKKPLVSLYSNKW